MLDSLATYTPSSANIDAEELAGGPESRTLAPSLLDGLGQVLAIFQADHSSSPSWKIADSALDSTSKAAVPESALS